ncbi:hypothetical protein BY996DRAFT_6422901 [Phakopsora pachyrhizi]|nr:hypothetical protein BY996DRAFT_6422901 [Phakopsora pachyrhizi]
MLSYATILCLLSVSGLVRSVNINEPTIFACFLGVVPTKPGPGETYNEGGQCQIAWALDTTGTWNSFSIDLMSGSNFAMQQVVNVLKNQDGTKGPGTYSFPCPEVTPNSAIYFYQFSQHNAETTWTTRFTIASADGQTTPPANPNQPNGQPIPWGIGALASANTQNSSSATPVVNTTATVTPPLNGNLTALTTPANTTSSSNNITNSNVNTTTSVTYSNPPSSTLGKSGASNSSSGTTPSAPKATGTGKSSGSKTFSTSGFYFFSSSLGLMLIGSISLLL